MIGVKSRGGSVGGVGITGSVEVTVTKQPGSTEIFNAGAFGVISRAILKIKSSRAIVSDGQGETANWKKFVLFFE